MFSFNELKAANELAILVDAEGLTPSTLSRLVHDFITTKQLNQELLAYVKDRLKTDAGEASPPWNP